jgi:hypothetical protein
MSRRLVSLSRRESGAWEWEIRREDGTVTRYRTDGCGGGLFIWGVAPGDIEPTWVQTRGTLQFSLPQTEARASAKIRQHFGAQR